MSDKRFEIAPPDRDGRRCVCEWLEITREGERHVFEYFREYTPAPEAASAATPSDAVTQALDAFNGNDPMAYGETKRMTRSLSTFAAALLEESDKTCKVLYSDERSLVNRVLTKAISNLLPEVKP
jgi:hypothetical protein